MPTDFIINSNQISTPGNATIAGVHTAQQFGGGKTLTTIATSPANVVPVTGRFAAITGAGIATCTIGAGTVDGQSLTILNLGAACTITAATSGLAASSTLASLASHNYVWEQTTALWYQQS